MKVAKQAKETSVLLAQKEKETPEDPQKVQPFAGESLGTAIFYTILLLLGSDFSFPQKPPALS